MQIGECSTGCCMVGDDFSFLAELFSFSGENGSGRKDFFKKVFAATAVSRAHACASSASLEINLISLFLPLSFILLLRARV